MQKALFHRALGDSGIRTADEKKTVDLLVAHRVKARSNSAKEFRDAVVRSWIGQGLGITQPTIAEFALPDLRLFADRVLAAARSCPTGRFGEGKVFIVHVWRTLNDTPEFRGMDFPTFKKHLAEANNRRFLDLSRADLVQAMDPEDVQLSETSYLNATFHFIRTDAERNGRS